jgi:RimJ/RimL family protein N-acetyltransferase
MILRRATLADSDLLLAWRNDPITRANSRNEDLISREDHEAWLARNIDNPDCEIWIAVLVVPIGVVRFENRDGGEWEVGIAVGPEYRDQGLGKHMLSMACTMKREPLWAVIKSGNAASIKVFESCGFEQHNSVGPMNFGFRRVPQNGFLLYRRDA